MDNKHERIYHRASMTAQEERFFQTIANTIWRHGIIKRPTVSRLAKMALNVIGKQYIEQEVKMYVAKQRSPIKAGPVNSSLMDEQ